MEHRHESREGREESEGAEVNKIPATWTNDCNGKKDFDGALVTLSTRYWPRGGGFLSYDTNTGIWKDNEDRPEIRPSAHATIYLGSATEFCDSAIKLADQSFKGDTEEQVKAAVEQWATEQYARIGNSLLAAFLDKGAK